MIEEACPTVAKDISGEDIIDANGNPIPGGGDTCPDTCEIIGEEKIGECTIYLPKEEENEQTNGEKKKRRRRL